MEAALHGDEESRIRALLAPTAAQDSLGYFATRRDKAVVFSPNGKAAVTYRVEAGVCLASGDPVGDRGAWTHAIDAWLEVAKRHGWQPAVMGATEDGAKAFARAGLGALQLGDEAILHVARFDLDGREMRVTRQAVNRVERTGATFRVRRHSALTDEEMQEVIHRADAWRDTETERGFSMALDRLGDPADGDCLLAEAFDGDGNLIALLSFVPWGTDGISLDVMRRDRTAPNGVMEFMVAELCGAAAKLGVRRISLNFAVFRSAFEEGARIGAGPVLRMWRKLLLFFSKWWQLEALYRSNAKYQPRVVPALPVLSPTPARSPGSVSPPASPRASWPSRAWASCGARGTREGGTNRPAPRACRRYRRWAWCRGRHRRRQSGTAAARAGARPPPQAGAAAGGRHRPVSGGRPAAHPHPRRGPRRASRSGPEPDGHQVTVAGRVLLVRDLGGVVFAVLRDWSGDLQIALTRDGAGHRCWTASAPTSTSATMSRPRARSAPATAASCRCS